jgi:hypothetical protein
VLHRRGEREGLSRAIPFPWETGSVFEPLGDEPFARVYVYLPKGSVAGVDELVRDAGRHHDYLATARLDDVVSGRERDAALLYDEDLLVGMPVQLRAEPRKTSTTMNETLVSA